MADVWLVTHMFKTFGLRIQLSINPQAVHWPTGHACAPQVFPGNHAGYAARTRGNLWYQATSVKRYTNELKAKQLVLAGYLRLLAIAFFGDIDWVVWDMIR